VDFQARRRQQFLGEQHYKEQLAFWDDVIQGQQANLLKPEGKERGWHRSLLQGIADELLIKLTLHYTAGEPIEPRRQELEPVIAAHERYGELLRKNVRNDNETIFDFTSLDDYCQLMQLTGLCFLLHRRDLLPRLAALQDGQNGANGGVDTLYEEFMAYGLGAETRYESDWLCHKKPYEPLFHALTETSPAAALIELDRFLKHWYKDLAGTGWHDSHKPDENGNQGGYYGYWSFEAGAAVLLLGIEDDSSLHKYLYYPKDLVAWAREHAHLSDTSTRESSLRLRCEAGEPCPRAGWWVTPAMSDSRRRFREGEVMPDLNSNYGTTIWQWDDNQT
jgi:hypothetical protein